MGHQNEGNKRDLLARQKQHIAKVGSTCHLSNSKRNTKQRKNLLKFQHPLCPSSSHHSEAELMFLKSFPVQEHLPCNLLVEQLKEPGLHAAFAS